MLRVALSLVLTLAAALPVSAQDPEIDDPKRLSQLLAALDLQPGEVVADVGAGNGGYVNVLARAVGATGKVIAVDISPRALDGLRRRVARDNLMNVEVVEGAVDNPKLPAGAVDAILVVHAYHEMTEHTTMLARMREALKPSGLLVIVEPISPNRRDATREVQIKAHQLAPHFALEEVHAAGFDLASFNDPLDSAHRHDNHGEWLLAARPRTAPPLHRVTSVNGQSGLKR